MPILLAKAWQFLKTYWSYIALAVGAVVALLVFRQEKLDFADQLKQIQDSHDAEMKKIDDIRLEERKEHEANEAQLQSTLAAVQAQYTAAEKDLDDKKKAEIEDLVKKYSDDPTELARQLSVATGFNVVLPS